LVANAGGLCWEHVDHAPFNSAVRFLDAAIVTGKGEKPAPRKPFRYSLAMSSDCL
jgi:hypothetical protein